MNRIGSYIQLTDWEEMFATLNWLLRREALIERARMLGLVIEETRGEEYWRVIVMDKKTREPYCSVAWAQHDIDPGAVVQSMDTLITKAARLRNKRVAEEREKEAGHEG